MYIITGVGRALSLLNCAERFYPELPMVGLVILGEAVNEQYHTEGTPLGRTVAFFL
jgi:hypothetical protein